jgi:signal transduction histidine kinase
VTTGATQSSLFALIDDPRSRAADAEDALSTVFAYEVLLGIIQAIVSAQTSGEALEVLYRQLHQHYGLAAMALEVTSGAVTHFQPFGDTSVLAAEEAPRKSGDVQYVRCALGDSCGLPGHISYVFPPDVCVEARFLEAITVQVAMRLAHEGLSARVEAAEDKARQRISEVATIYEIGQAIDKIEHSRLLQLITDRAALLMDAQACSLMLKDEETGRLRLAASYGLPEDALSQEQWIGEGIAWRVAQTQQPMLIVGNVQDPRLAGVTLRPEISSSMLVPVKSQEDEVLGVLCIRRCRPAPDFSDEELKLFSVFATQAALALTNKHLYEDLKNRAGDLLKISTALSRVLRSTLDFEELLESVADDICDVVGFARCCLFLHDPARHVYTARIWRNYPNSIGRNPIREKEGAIGGVAREKSMRVYDARDSVGEEWEKSKFYLQLKGFARSLGTDAFVALPILTSNNECLGVVVADNRGRRGSISPEQITLLAAFVNQAGIALENARLVEEMQENFRKIHRLKNYNDNVLHSISAGIVSTDARGRVELWNPAAEHILKISSGAFRNSLLTDLIGRMELPPVEREHLLDMIARVLENGVPIHHDRLPLHPQGLATMTLDLRLSRLVDYNEERAGVVLSFADVTQEVKLSEEVERMRRLADIGQLAAKMAHEVRNALSPIKGAAQIIRLEMQGQGSSTEWPDIIIAEVDGLSHLTSAMLDFARPTPLDPRPMAIREFLIGAVLSLNTFLSEHQVTIRWELSDTVPEIWADPIQLGQVVRNIVMNAAQSMPEGGTLFVKTDYDPTASLLIMHFRDTGIGIAQDEIGKIFRPFVTTKMKGTGLGLPIVQKIVDRHGGRVEVESQVGVGTQFSVLLPLRPPLEVAEMLLEGPPLISSRPTGPYPDN